MAITAANYTELLAATVSEHEKKLVDQLVKSHPVLDLVADLTTPLNSHSLVLPIQVAENNTVTGTDDNGTFSTAYEGDLVSVAKYDVGSPVVATAMVPWKILQMNSGSSSQILDLAKTHISAAVTAQKKAIAKAFWNPQGTAGRPFDSILDIVSATGVLGGINPASASYWKSHSYTVDTADEADLGKIFRKITNRVDRDATDSVDVVLAGLDVFEEFEEMVLARTSYIMNQGDGSKAQTRFREYFHGNLLVRYDPDAPVDTAAFLRKSALKFRPVAGNFMKATEKQPIVGSTPGQQTLNWIQPFVTLAVFGTDERRAHAVLKRTRTGTKANPNWAL